MVEQFLTPPSSACFPVRFAPSPLAVLFFVFVFFAFSCFMLVFAPQVLSELSLIHI